RDVDGLVDLYRHDAALHWMPLMTRSDWGTLGLTEVFTSQLAGVTSCEARYGPSIGPDNGLCGAPFHLRRDDDVYEGWAFLRLSPTGGIEIDRRYQGPFFEVPRI